MSVITPDATITIALSVSDRYASAVWFEKMLGFGVLYHMDEAGWSELSTTTPGVTLGLGEQGQPNPGNAVPVFGVADIHSARSAVEAEDVKFDGATETMDVMVSLATFYDPDGNAMMIAQDLSAQG